MKTILNSRIQLVISIIMLAFSTIGFSQKAIIWKGGTPGMKDDWNCPQNWNTSSVPDEFSNVYIPDVSTSTFSSPVIYNGKIEVNYLFIESNASLTIKKPAQLVVNGSAEGLRRENLHLEGSLIILNNEPESTLHRITNK